MVKNGNICDLVYNVAGNFLKKVSDNSPTCSRASITRDKSLTGNL